jgi:hypothetical protein
MSRIFISKDPEDLSIELQALVQTSQLEAQTLIEFSAIPFECPPPHDILFIASIRAADFFFANCQTNAQIACAGLETAKKVAERYQKEVHFIAQQSDQPVREAQKFNVGRGLDRDQATGHDHRLYGRVCAGHAIQVAWHW